MYSVFITNAYFLQLVESVTPNSSTLISKLYNVSWHNFPFQDVILIHYGRPVGETLDEEKKM